jgi:uncharacterized protein YbjT (DUF2867 family)
MAQASAVLPQDLAPPPALPGRVLIAGATGFVGRALAAHLARGDAPLRLLARHPPEAGLPEEAEVTAADVRDPVAMRAALDGVDTLVYLVHSMGGPRGEEFEARDREAAQNTVEAAEAMGVRRILYLGGLGEGQGLSPHLASRREVAAVLGSGAPQLTALRAALVIGPGSASWEMLRGLVERLPVMVCPRWVRTRCQPVALRDAVAALAACIGDDATAGQAYDLGGPDVLTYRRMMEVVGELVGRVPFIVEVPVLTPQLSALWVDFVTDTPKPLAHALIEGMRNDVVCTGQSLDHLLPAPPLPFREAARLALQGRW